MTKIKSKHQPTDEEYEAWLEYMTTQCYGCATQRYRCEHDDINWEEYFAEEDMHEKDTY
jgi:hypothetical protein